MAATTYTVATTGADTNPGTSAAPFRTIQKCASVAVGGDVCEIRAGVYRETVTPKNSGSSGAPIEFRAAAGAQVTVSGSDEVGGWTAHSGSIYKAAVTIADPSRQQVFIGDEMVDRARWPNAGSDRMRAPLAFSDDGTNTTTLVDAALPSIPGGWNGANFHVWAGSAWMSATGTITSTAAGSLGFSGANSECGGYLCVGSGARYYLDGVLGALDTAGEFNYDATAHQLYLWAPGGGVPSSVSVKQREWAFDLSGRSFINVTGIKLQAASIRTSGTSTDNILDKLDVRYASHFDTIPIPNVADDSVAAAHLLTSGIILAGTRNTLRNSQITWSAGNGVSVQGTYNRVENNLISRVNYMGTWSAGVYIRGQNETVTRNTIFDTGRDGITGNYLGDGIFGSANTDFTNNTISYNEIFNWGVMNDDSGGIYLCCGADMSGGSVSYNYVHDNNARGRKGSAGSGIMLDNGTKNMTVHHNVVRNALTAGLGINGDFSGTAQNAKIYNNTFMGGQLQSIGTYNNFGYADAQIKNNILETQNNLDGYVQSQSNNSTVGSAPGYLAEGPFLDGSSSLVNGGVTVPGITDGFADTAPDIGAHEVGALGWRAGCSLSDCTFPTDAAHSIDGSASAVTYSAGWGQCTVNCDARFSAKYHDGTISYTGSAGATATVTFTGTRAQLFGQTATGGGLGTVSIDGGPPVQVDWYSGSFVLPAAIGNLLLYTTPKLSPGTHTLTITALGTGNYGGSYINLDRVAVTPSTTTATVVGNGTTGTGLNQVAYSSGWTQCKTACNGAFGEPTVVFHNGDVAHTATANQTATIRFYGDSIDVYGATGIGGGVGGIRIDGGAEETVSWYRNTVLTGNQKVYSSPSLGWGYHTIQVRATGTNGAGGYPYINLDRFDVKN